MCGSRFSITLTGKGEFDAYLLYCLFSDLILPSLKFLSKSKSQLSQKLIGQTKWNLEPSRNRTERKKKLESTKMIMTQLAAF